jgi:hypothetical protein
MAEIVWKLTDPHRIGGLETEILGEPKVIGDAVQFNGRDTGIIVPVIPLTGKNSFSLQVRFMPDADGPQEQRFVHLQQLGIDDRILIELRLTGDGNWFLDTFIKSGDTNQTLYAQDFPHPCGQWYVATLVYDGHEMRHYVNEKMEMRAEVAFTAPLAGSTSLGMRINRVSWFKGSISEVCFKDTVAPIAR